MKVYVQLAVLSEEKKQPLVRDRFLLLAGVEACRAGWPEVAARCHQWLTQSNPAHLTSRHATIADALRNAEFQQLVSHWERYCPFEKAEAMLKRLDLPSGDAGDGSVGEQMLKLLAESSAEHPD